MPRIAEACRIILAIVFIFSGLVKTIDPWGTAVKLTEYFGVFGMEWLSGWSAGLAITLCAAELTMGLMLLFRVFARLVSVLALITIAAFTILTFVMAVWNPLDGCGCLGEAIRLENWQSFFKNLILLPMGVVLWRTYRKRRMFGSPGRDAALTLLFAALAVSLGVYSWRHLPLVDLFPYKTGTNLREDVLCTSCIDRDLKLLYADRQTGEERLFELSDTTWYDDTKWEYIRTVTPYDENPPRIFDYDFAMWRGGLNEADAVIFRDGDTHMIVIRDARRGLSAVCEKKLAAYVDRLVGEGANVICAAGFNPNSDESYEVPPTLSIGGNELTCYGMESALLQKLLRADAGSVVIRDGIIISKTSCRDLK